MPVKGPARATNSVTGPDAVPAPQASADGSAACVANINDRERRKRLVSGLAQLAVGAFILAALLALGAGRWWRLALLPVFWGAGLGFFQWRDKT
jgi:hypothetical protein